MPRRQILTDRQRSALLDLPTDEASLLKFYTLADDDLEHIYQRRRPENRLGVALYLTARMRHWITIVAVKHETCRSKISNLLQIRDWFNCVKPMNVKIKLAI